MATSYVTRAEVYSLAVTQAQIDAFSISTADQDAAIAAASAEADAYLRQRYTLPVSSYGSDLKQHVANMAAYRLFSRGGYTAAGGDKRLRVGWTDAIAWLKTVADGSITPEIEDGEDVAGAEVLVFSDTTESRGW